MADMSASGGIKTSSISMVVLDANGNPKMNLGVVSYYHKNPIIRFFKSRWITYFANKRIKAFNERQGNING